MNRKWMIYLCMLLLLITAGCRKQDPVEPVDPDPTPVQVENVDFDLIEYKVYNLEQLDYQFAVAKVRIKADKAVNYSLADLLTDEGIALSEKDTYCVDLNKKGISYSQFGLSEELTSRNNSAVFTLLVPVKDKNRKTVEVSLKQLVKIEIDLTKNLGTAEELGLDVEDTIINTEEYQVEVLSCTKITGETLFYHGEVVGSSTSDLYAFKVLITSFIKEGVKVSEAEYVSASTSDTFEALEEGYETEKKENMLGVNIEDEKEAYVFFQLLNPEKEDLSYEGVLRLCINGQWYNVKVNL